MRFTEFNDEARAKAKATQCHALMCLNKGTKTCAGCKRVRYCSKECQLNDWNGDYSEPGKLSTNTRFAHEPFLKGNTELQMLLIKNQLIGM